MILARNIVAIVVCLAAASICFAYVATNQRRKAKKKIYAVAGGLYIAAASVYGLALTGYDGYILKSGLLTVGIVVLLSSAWISNVLADWRKV